ncbi:MAG: hypothetical protein E7368_00125 [Clostridiales bacterium]|nr:hypothetical protein [Clostridiales bacterium]
MRKSFMKKLFATLAVATFATVGAGVAFTNNTKEASADTGVISTDFSSATLPTGLSITNSSAIVAENGELKFNTGIISGASIVTTQQYTNFVLEYDLNFTSGEWAPIVYFGNGTSTVHTESAFIYVNAWGAVANRYNNADNTMFAAFLPGSINPYASGAKTHVKVTVQAGAVTLTLKDLATNAVYENQVATGINKTGVVGVPSSGNAVFSIDNLSITNLDTAQTVPTPPATTVKGTSLNNCDYLGGWYGTNGTCALDTEIKSQGTGSLKHTLSAGNYFIVMVRDYSNGDAELTLEQLLAYDGLYFEVYNPGSAVDLKFFNSSTVATTLQTGWNQVTISKANIQSAIDANAEQFVGGEFRFTIGGDATIYLDNVMGITPASSGGDSGSTDNWTLDTSVWSITHTNAITQTTGALSFVTGADAVTYDGAAIVTNSSYTNFQLEFDMSATASGGWLPIAFFGATESNMYYHNNFLHINDWGALKQLNISADTADIVDLNTSNVSPYTNRIPNGEQIHVKLVVNNGNVVLTLTKGTGTFSKTLYTGINVTGKVGIPATINSNFNISNVTITDLGESGGEGGGTTPETPVGEGSTAYTKFDGAVDSNWAITGGTRVSVSNGQLVYANNTATGDGIYTTGKYTNFILEYDITPTLINQPVEDPQTGWIPVIMFSVGDNANIGGANNFVYMNQYGAIVGLNPSGQNIFTPALVGSPHSAIVNTTTHVRVEAQDGTVTAYFKRGSQETSFVIGNGLNTTGRVGIPVSAETGLIIDNLVIVNSDEYADYQVNKITLANDGPQANANETLTGNLLDEIKRKAQADGIDITNKSFVFRSKTDGFFLDSKTGEWEYTVGPYNGLKELEYVITVNDLVLDGWVYPLGNRGMYTIEGNIAVTIIGGMDDPNEGGEGGGAGDTSELPVIVGDNVVEHVQGKVQDVSFIIDTKSYKITRITYNTENVKVAAYTLEEVEEGIKLTFKGDFVALLEKIGDNEFKIETIKGFVDAIIRVKVLETPEIIDGNSAEMWKNYETDAVFNLNTFELPILSILRTGASSALNSDAYTYADGVLTIKKEYLATLDASDDAYRFSIYTDGGSVSVNVTIKFAEEPYVDPESAEFTLGSENDVEFELDTMGAPIVQIVRDNEEKALGDNAYAFDADAMSLTFKKEYLAALGAGEYEFTITTPGGDAVVTITVLPGDGPTCTDNKKNATFGENANVSFTVNTNGQAIVAIQRTGATYGLGEDAYTYENGTLTIVGDYVALLPLGENEFTLETANGSIKFYINVVEETPENPDNPDNPDNPEDPEDGEYEGGEYEEDNKDNPFEEDITNPDEGEEPIDPEEPDDGGNSGSGSYEDEFTGSVKPSEDSYNKYLEGLENGGQVSGGCNGSLSMVAGLPVVGIIAWLIRKKKED